MSQAFITYNQSNDRIKNIHTYQTIFYKRMGPNKENFTEKFNKQSKLGMGPTKRISLRNSTSKASWGWAPTKRISL
ncbi:hypothetical protein H700_03708 [Staphylococcus epidermidis 41tr]|nr:hypothetical protein H700_03708 [Staphylococcus epidermidis 41tr]